MEGIGSQRHGGCPEIALKYGCVTGHFVFSLLFSGTHRFQSFHRDLVTFEEVVRVFGEEGFRGFLFLEKMNM